MSELLGVRNTLEEYVAWLNEACLPSPHPKVLFDITSETLIWSDEITNVPSVELIWALKPLFVYRTGLILQKPSVDSRPIWEFGLSLFPK